MRSMYALCMTDAPNPPERFTLSFPPIVKEALTRSMARDRRNKTDTIHRAILLADKLLQEQADGAEICIARGDKTAVLEII